MMKKGLIIYAFFLLGIFTHINSLAQPAKPGNPNGNKDSDVPISGIEILIGLGGLFGASRFFKGKNKSK